MVPLPATLPVCTTMSPVPTRVPAVIATECAVVVAFEPLSSDHLPPAPLKITSYRVSVDDAMIDLPVVVAVKVMVVDALLNVAPLPTYKLPPIE